MGGGNSRQQKPDPPKHCRKGKKHGAAKIERIKKEGGDEVRTEVQVVEGKRGIAAGVRVGWLKQFASRCMGLTTLDVVLKIVKNETLQRLCRYVDIMEPTDVGQAQYFLSHTWFAPFNDLVAAASYVGSDSDFVWIDIFAVLQHTESEGITEHQKKERMEDLDFGSVVRASKALILVAQHVPSIANMDRNDAIQRRVPEEAKRCCAFFRVWCIVELLAARDAELPVIMLVGNSDSDFCFQANDAMLDNLLWMMDIAQASASFEADRVRILSQVQQHPGFKAANTSFKGAVAGAMRGCMFQPGVIRCALGDSSTLEEQLQTDPQSLGAAMLGAAAAGLLQPLRLMLEKGVAVDVRGEYALTPLISAAQGGQAQAVRMLLAANADVDASSEHGVKAMDEASAHGHQEVVRLLREAGARDVNLSVCAAQQD